MLPNKTYYSLADAAERAQCKPSDLIDYASQGRISLLVGIPDWVDILVYDADAQEDLAPFLMSPELLVLDPPQCRKLLLTGHTQQSDFREGYIVGSDRKLKKLLPHYGYPGMTPQWAYWRLYREHLVYLLDLVPDRLFVLHEDLERLLASAPTEARKETEVASSPRAAQPDTADIEPAPPREEAETPVVPRTTRATAKTTNSPAHASSASEEEGRGMTEEVLSPKPPGIAILRLKQVMAMTGLSRSTIYDLLDKKSKRHDPAFPKQVRISQGTVGWLESDVQKWLAARTTAGAS